MIQAIRLNYPKKFVSQIVKPNNDIAQIRDSKFKTHGTFPRQSMANSNN